MNKNPQQYHQLKERWTNRHRETQRKLWDKHPDALHWFTNNVKHLTAGVMGGIMLLTSPAHPSLPLPHTLLAQQQPDLSNEIDSNVFLISDLGNILPKEIRALNAEEEQQITQRLTQELGFSVKAQLEGKRLNRSYGYIGAEQHLARFPGDTMASHFDTDEDAQKYYSSGMAPGLGAWGYFTPSQAQMTEKDTAREKYYIAVQTFLSPGYMDNVGEHNKFYKYRKMLVMNPQNGKTMVVVIGDAGPAEWTGKHLGGSPEVMKYLERVDGKQKGPVLYFFIDDPDDTIPLGPIERS